jgi:hypothetical protein
MHAYEILSLATWKEMQIQNICGNGASVDIFILLREMKQQENGKKLRSEGLHDLSTLQNTTLSG